LNIADTIKAFDLILEQTPHEIFHKSLLSATEVLLTKLLAYTKENNNPDTTYSRVFFITLLV
jgi:hypothetical protein